MGTQWLQAVVQRDMHGDEDERPPEDEKPKHTKVIASTDAADRMGDVVDQSWKLDEFRKNPVILFGHDYSQPPVGRAVSVEVRDGRLVAEIEWDTGHAMGALVARQFAEGFLNAVSVGFKPGRQVPRSLLDEKDPRYAKGEYGVVFLENTLLEISAVPVPANGEALASRAQKSDDALVERILEAVRGAVREELAPLRDDIDALLISDVAKSLQPQPDFWAENAETVTDWFSK